MQVAVPGDSYHPEKTADGMKVIAGPKFLCCSFCDKKITQGWYYGESIDPDRMPVLMTVRLLELPTRQQIGRMVDLP